MIRHLENVLKQDEYRDDIEALLNYVVVAHMLEEDSLVSRMQSRLVGVVRDEGTVIANDEIGRASLVFAVMNLMSNDLVQAGENLSSAESTYPNSIPFKLSVGMCLQLIGEFSRSKKQFEQVLKMDSRNVTALLGMGRAQYAKLVNLKSSKVRRGKSNRPSSWAVTSLGRAELTFSSFSRVHVQMNNTIFPEEAYLEASKLHQGEKLSNELKYINFVHAARSMFATGKVGLAKKYFEEALKLTQRPEVLSALGTVLLQTKRYLPALKSFDAALAMDDSLIEARLGKARVLVNQEKPLKAIELLKAIQDDVGLVPEATLLNARLQAERGNDRGELDLLQTLSENLTDSPELWLRIGRSLHANEESEQAVEAYRRALDLQSRLRARPATKKRRRKETRTAVDFLYLGRILSKDSAVRAKQMFLASVDLQGTPTESHYFLGKLLLKNGASRRAGKRSLKLYLRKAPKGDYAADVKKLIRRR
jgi:tetratricopeptide (TPR) repeat protein